MNERAEAAWIARSREETLFADLYNRNYRAIRDFCRRRLPKDLVDDAVAETFLTAWRRIDDVPTGDAALVWLYSVAYRVVGHQWRSSARQRRLEDKLRIVDGQGVVPADDSAVMADQRQLVLEAAARLNERDVEVLRLVAWEQLSLTAVAKVLDIAPNAVKQRLHRAKQHLAREYRRLESRTPNRPTPDAPKGGAR